VTVANTFSIHLKYAFVKSHRKNNTAKIAFVPLHLDVSLRPRRPGCPFSHMVAAGLQRTSAPSSPSQSKPQHRPTTPRAHGSHHYEGGGTTLQDRQVRWRAVRHLGNAGRAGLCFSSNPTLPPSPCPTLRKPLDPRTPLLPLRVSVCATSLSLIPFSGGGDKWGLGRGSCREARPPGTLGLDFPSA
jgi:hypothetical protein